APVGTVTHTEMHRTIMLLPLPHRIVVLLAKFVEADRNFAAHKPRVFIAVGFHKPTHLLRFGLTLNIDDPAILDDKRHRMLPSTRWILRRHFPNHGSVRRSRHRLHMRLAPWPGAAG